ncbi:LysR substrate-binding domain-containing protein [Allopontixanthobacter sp.]|uniref:LysR substrate-binding domain-containing protein n=1 Tax=Allopontixanthobacter sp. TaxID=2906452 RepID=UPI002ABAD65D|nr:LysR substrate-binding domain-containing protein [Allopontixanthobacter sp.]MDZ4307645.1 LysR substrate-binding domain-containing protein [Allopontixanthobacter sp.]
MDVFALNLRHLRAIVEISRCGSISGAATAVNLTQPAITQALAKLESGIGQPLFVRRADGMSPTPAAELLVSRAEAALNHIASSRVTMAQLRALVALADAGSYAGASAATALSQPSLHRAVGDLSLALRRELVTRRGKGIALTDAGRNLARRFRLALAELTAAISELHALQGRETGRLAIGAMPLSRARLLPAAVSAFHRLYPDVHISIVEGAFHELVEPLRDGALDLIIGAVRDPAPGPDLDQTVLFEDRPVVLARHGHPMQGSDVRRLAQYPWIVPSPGTPLRGQWERIFCEAGIAAPRVPIECGSVITIRQILMDSDFLTLLSPDQVAVELEAGWLRRICDAPPGLVRRIGLTTRANWRPTARQASFMELLDIHAGGS